MSKNFLQSLLIPLCYFKKHRQIILSRFFSFLSFNLFDLQPIIPFGNMDASSTAFYAGEVYLDDTWHCFLLVCEFVKIKNRSFEDPYVVIEKSQGAITTTT